MPRGAHLYKHGLTGTRIFRIWTKMKERCYNPNHKHYDNYGGRGITVCADWKNDAVSFYNWAIANGYQEDLTIERLDNDKGYSPDNCTWITKAAQNRHTSQNVRITLFGEEKLLHDWLKDDRTCSKSTYYRRVDKGLSPEEALRRS